jgi:adenosylmethionine-8-amino-7-oxononanoate aminotransferase
MMIPIIMCGLQISNYEGGVPMKEIGTDTYKVIHPFTFMPEYQSTTADQMHEQLVCLKRGEGPWVYDENGKSFLYTTTAVPSVGLGNQYVIDAMTKQMKCFSFGSTCAQTHPLINRLAARLIEHSGKEYASVFFSNDGSGAVETAMRLARQYYISLGQSERTKFISLEGNYHGTTFGSGSVTQMGIQESFGPGLEGCLCAPTPNLYRPPIEGTEEEIIEFCIQKLNEIITLNNPETITAILLEPIQGVNGIIPLPKQYVQEVKRITKRYGILLIMDEVATGVGRTGHWIVSHYYEVTPDFVALSKGLTGGYFPMGVTLASVQVVNQLFGHGGIFLHGSTQSGHPIGCAAALAVLDLIESKNLIENTKHIGEYILAELKDKILQHPNVGDIRGKGLMLAIEFVKDKQAKESIDFSTGERLSKYLHKEGVLGNYFNGTLIMYPPLNLSPEEADYLIDRVSRAIQKLN